MTTIKICKKNGRYTSVIATGHTGFGDFGSDILCASISAIIQTAGLGLKKLVTDRVELVVDEKQPMYKIILPDDLSEQLYPQAELILKTCILGLRDLQSGYSKYLKVEVKNYVY